MEAGQKMSKYANVKTLRKLSPARLLKGVRPSVPGSYVLLASVVRRWPRALQTRRQFRPHIRRGAFTLIELMIVVVIIFIAAMTAVPMMSSAGSLQIRSAANMIAADLEYAKSMAISRGQYYSVVFDTTNETYKVKNQAGSVISHPVKKGFNFVVNFRNDSRLNKVDIVSVNFNSTGEVKFDYLSSPYDGDMIALGSAGVITICAGTITKTISVEPVTGYITISN